MSQPQQPKAAPIPTNTIDNSLDVEVTMTEHIKDLLSVGDVGLYKTIDGVYGCSLDFYDKSYYLAIPAKTIELAVKEMHDEWRVKSAMKHPEWNEAAYNKNLEDAAYPDDANEPPSVPQTPAKATTPTPTAINKTIIECLPEKQNGCDLFHSNQLPSDTCSNGECLWKSAYNQAISDMEQALTEKYGRAE